MPPVAGNAWSRMVASTHGEAVESVKMVRDLQRFRHDIVVNANKHRAGSVLPAIATIRAALERYEG